jgi:2-oxoglutarate ferredoxin oxidoreductase subunit alpha
MKLRQGCVSFFEQSIELHVTRGALDFFMTSTTPASADRIVNDMSIQFATVNGSGSQSANNIITKAIFRMGIPVGPKNLFPSNIQGLPTWYTIRISKHGYRARKKELDWVVCMNPDTLVEDVKSVQPGGVVVYNTDILPKGYTPTRSDVIYYPIPFTSIARDKVKDVKLRKLLVNVLYVGVLTELLGIDVSVVEGVIRDTFASKPKAIDANLEALHAGMTYAKENLKKQDKYRLESMGENKNMFLAEGNSLAALGCVMGGCTVVGWYPITPSSSLAESFMAYCEKHRKDDKGNANFAIIQAEDELASIGMVLGAGWAGARAMTATSGPGISLMAEFAGLAYFAEIPSVIFNVQRMGPSTGLPTRTCQGDILSAATLSHGDTKHVLLIPGTPEEAYEFSRISFDLAEQLQTLVFVMLDLDLGMNIWNCTNLAYPTEPFKRGKVVSAKDLDSERFKNWGRYKDIDGDGVPYRSLPGTEHNRAAYFTRGTGHTEMATYSEKPEDWQKNIDRLDKKWETARGLVPKPIISGNKNKVGIIYYGTTDLCMNESIDQLRSSKLEVDTCRIRAVPITDDVIEFIKTHDRVYVVEQNRDGQMEDLLRMRIKDGNLINKIRSFRHYNGMPLDARTVTDGVLSFEKK